MIKILDYNKSTFVENCYFDENSFKKLPEILFLNKRDIFFEEHSADDLLCYVHTLKKSDGIYIYNFHYLKTKSNNDFLTTYYDQPLEIVPNVLLTIGERQNLICEKFKLKLITTYKESMQYQYSKYTYEPCKYNFSLDFFSSIIMLEFNSVFFEKQEFNRYNIL